MTKKFFNLTDLTKEVYGNGDTNSSIFQSNRKKIENHFKEVRKMLGRSPEKLEVPIEQLESYVYLIKNLLENPENDETLNLLKKKMIKNKPLSGATDEETLKNLIKIVAEAAARTLPEEDGELYKRFIQDQLSNDYYTASEKNMSEVKQIVSNDFLLFDNLNSLTSKIELQKQYMEAIRKVSSTYNLVVKEHMLFQECFLEVMNSHPHINKKIIYNDADFLALPPSIQQEIRNLIEKKLKEAF